MRDREPESEPEQDTGFELLGLPLHSDENSTRSRTPFEVLVTQFVEELRTGSRPSIERYARRYPPHAEQIRDVFPMLAMLEESRVVRESQSIRRQMPGRFPLTRIGGCELQQEIGRGGMGVVFRAVEQGHTEPLAVKVLPWRSAVVPRWVERFRKEAEMAQGLQHNGIVPVLRSGEQDGYCYLVMPLIAGVGLDVLIRELGRTEKPVDLAELIQEKTGLTSAVSENPVLGITVHPTDWKRFTQMAISAASALCQAHRGGICHNDIKPANLLVEANGEIQITDFGLAGTYAEGKMASTSGSRPALRSEGPESESRELGGTLRYMAPERFSRGISVSADIFSFGATLYELSLQCPAFDESDAGLMKQKIHAADYVPPARLDPGIPRSLETLICNCLAADPADRYASVDQLLVDLGRAAAGKHVSSTRRTSVHRVWRSLRDG